MKKIICLLLLYISAVRAQTETECPFAPQKYVHYDGKIESSSTYLATQYQQLLQNNSAYERVNDHFNSSAKATCFYKTSIHNHDSIKKPFVFVEGISFEKKSISDNEYTMKDYFRQDWAPSPPTSQPECFAAYNSAPQYLGELVGYSTFNWATLVTGIDAEGHFDGDPLQVQKAPELLNKLCCAGYDICFVDFHSGEEYIESNGEALYSILLKIHQSLIDNNSNEKMVVCGASMGGLVARYAINKLEAEGHTDWVEKFISFDSPQMGANIPLGVQYTLKHMKGLSNSIKEKYNKLTCPSASQLVNYSCLETNLGSPITYTTPSPSIERTELLSNPYMGWPQHCTKIAISNGSRYGTPQSSLHQPADKVLDIDGLIDLDIFALPRNDGSYNKVFDFDPPICISAFLTPFFPLVTQQSVRVKNTMALDLAAGSYRRDLNDIENQLPGIITGIIGQGESICNLSWLDNSTNTDKLCFIPLMSSIGAIQYETIMKSNAAIVDLYLNTSFDGEPRFEDYAHNFSNFDVVYAPSVNQTHVEITDENISWVMEELTGMDEYILHQNVVLSSNTYKALNFIMSGNNINNNTNCDPPPPGVVYDNFTLAQQYMFCGDVIVPGNNAVFYKAGNFISLEPGFYTQNDAFFDAEIINTPFCYSSHRMAPSSGTTDVLASIDNPSFEAFQRNKIKKELFDSETAINIFPNPSNTYCDISSNETIDYITISSIMGTIINSVQINQNNYRIATDNLSNGVYMVNIKTPNKNTTKKIIVRHE